VRAGAGPERGIDQGRGQGHGGGALHMQQHVEPVVVGTHLGLQLPRVEGSVQPCRDCVARGGIYRSSTAGLVGNPHGSPIYTATNGAARLFTKATAMQPAAENIRCNSVHPGPIDTVMLVEAAGELPEAYRRRVPLGRFGTTEDTAYGVLYMASDESSFVTGSELVIDGGSTAQ
jgi:NAD(P)-dependent dehydrogenase (short-subunit alcohol dehydrogenase family)